MGTGIRDPSKTAFRMESAKSLAQLATIIVEILTWVWRKAMEVTASPTEKDMKENSKITLCGVRGNTFFWTAILMRAILGETSVSGVGGTLMEIKKIWNWEDLRGSIQQTWEKEAEYWNMIRWRWRATGKMDFINSLLIPIWLNDFYIIWLSCSKTVSSFSYFDDYRWKWLLMIVILHSLIDN